MIHTIFIVSDGTGMTAKQALKAAMMQFENLDIDIKVRPQTRSEEQVHEIVHEAAQTGGFVLHTLVTDRIRQMMLKLAREHNVDTIDLMGPLLSRLSQQFAISPSEKPGLFRQLNEDYFRRIETMEFAIRHDDGLRINELDQAEIVLVGVSRTFKTPLSIFLSFKGWFVANIPIVLDVLPPKELYEIDQGKIFGLTMEAARLAMLRQARHLHLGKSTGEYFDMSHVRRELIYALKTFRNEPSWPVIDVTSKPIEEISSEILAIISRKDD